MVSNKFIAPLALSALLFAALLPVLTMDGLYAYQDWAVHVHRMDAFYRALSNGVLFPRWLDTANAGYGAPVFVFYSPLSYYLGALMLSVGLAPDEALKVCYWFASAIGGLGMQRCLVIVHSAPTTALLGGLAYGLNPALMLVAWRFNMPASALAWGIMPWLLAAVFLSRDTEPRRVVLGALSFAAAALAHLLVAFQLAVLTSAWTVAACLVKRDMSSARVWVGALALGALISSAHLGPALFETGLVHTSYLTHLGWRIQDNLMFQWPRPEAAAFRLEYAYAVAIAGLACLLLLLAIVRHRVAKSDRKAWLPPVTAAATALVLMTPKGLVAYDVVPLLAMVQFGWRWLGPFLCLAMLAAVMPTKHAGAGTPSGGSKRLANATAFVTLAALISLSAAPLFALPWMGLTIPTRTTDRELIWASTQSRFDTLEHRPLSMGRGWDRNLSLDVSPVVYAIEGSSTIRVLGTGSLHVDVEVDSSKGGAVRFRRLAYPGWRAYIHGHAAPWRAEKDTGAIIVDVPAGKSVLSLQFQSTWWRRLFETIAAVALLALVCIWWIGRRRA